MASPSLILASSSPRRSRLLAEYGFDFEVRTAGVDELQDATMDPAALVAFNARLKALSVAQLQGDCVVLGADTVVAFGSKILGKPSSMEEAIRMLEELNGREHTTVRFHDLNAAQRLAYLQRINPLDKAGAYAAQDDAGELIAGFEGSFSNVIGLPMEPLVPRLAALGVLPRR